MTVITNSLCTVLILFRIVRISGIRSSLKSYRGLMEILVESAIMYTAVFIVLLVMYEREFHARGNAVMAGYGYPLMMSVSVTVSTMLLCLETELTWARASLLPLSSLVLWRGTRICGVIHAGPSHSLLCDSQVRRTMRNILIWSWREKT